MSFGVLKSSSGDNIISVSQMQKAGFGGLIDLGARVMVIWQRPKPGFSPHALLPAFPSAPSDSAYAGELYRGPLKTVLL